MKTSDEIKKGLKCCASVNAHCESCPFRTGIGAECIRHMSECAFEYIQYLENQIGELTEKVEQLEAAQPKWISVEERLPEPNTTVLLIAHGWEPQLVYIGKLEKVESEKSWLTGLVSKASEWTVYGFSYLKEPIVTHWMPIPSTEGLE